MDHYTKTISAPALENAKWHFNNNMTAKMDADRQQYQSARSVIEYLLERRTPKMVDRVDPTVDYRCPHCNVVLHWKSGDYCNDCGGALEWKYG